MNFHLCKGLSSRGQFHTPFFLCICNVAYAFVGCFVHFQTYNYPSLQGYIIGQFVMVSCKGHVLASLRICIVNQLIFIYCGLFCPHLGSFFFFFHYVSAKFHLWPPSGDLLRPRIGMMSLVTVSPVITAFHSCCRSHNVFDQVNLWPAWVGFEIAIF